MLRKSRFGSKVGSGQGRDADQDSNGKSDEGAEVDQYERSTERTKARSGASSKWGSKTERAGVERSAPARRISSAERALAAIATKAASASEAANAEDPAFSNPFEPADPFEPFEQCAPVPESEFDNPDGESVYSRSTSTRRSAADTNAKSKGPQRSLKGRALGYLSRREYSRTELARKLAPYVEETESVDTLLDALEREGWLSNERFVESILHRRSGRMGTSRIVNELKRHALDETLIGEAAEQLKTTEMARAHAIWSRKFDGPPATAAERAKQARFLTARGFSSGTIVKILKGEGGLEDGASDE
jgi:regulatory protein